MNRSSELLRRNNYSHVILNNSQVKRFGGQLNSRLDSLTIA
jgi:hypothetical protein